MKKKSLLNFKEVLFLLFYTANFLNAQVTTVFPPSQSQGVMRVTYQAGPVFTSDNTGQVEFDRGMAANYETKYRRYRFSHPNFLNSAMTQVVLNITFNKTSQAYYPNSPGIMNIMAPDLVQDANASWAGPGQTMIDGINWGTSIFSQAIGSPNNGAVTSISQQVLLNSLAFFDPNATAFTIGFQPVQDGLTITAINVSITYYANNPPPPPIPLISNNVITAGNSNILCAGIPPFMTGSTPGGGNGSFSFQWQQFNNQNGTWNDYLNATSSNFQSGAISQSSQFRRKVNSGAQVSISNVINVNVNPPSAPTNVVLAPQSTNIINVSWSSSNYAAAGYQIYNCPNNALLGGTSNLTFPVNLLVAGATYQFKVVAVCSGGSSPSSACVSGTTGTPLANLNSCCAQTSIGYNNPSFTALNLTTPTGGLGNYQYEWQSDGGTGSFSSPVIMANSNSQSFTPPPAQATTKYRCHVSSGPTGLIQGYSNPVVMTISTPPSPTGLIATAQSPNSIQLSWPTSPGAASYNVYDCANGSPIASGLTTLSYLHTGLASNSTHNYYIRAVCGALFSANSTCASATTLIPPLANNTICCSETHTGVQPSTQIFGSLPTGGIGGYTYQWQQSTTNWLYGYSDINGAINRHYTPPNNLSSFVYYRRIVTSGLQTSNSSAVLYNVVAPAAPLGLVVATQSAFSLLLSWNTSSGAQSYQIYDCATGTLLQTVNAPLTTAVVNGLNPVTNYGYYVVAVCGNLSSTPSTCSYGVTSQVPNNAQISTIAGNGLLMYNDNVFATQTGIYLLGPGGLTGDAQGNIYFADQSNHVIRKMDPTGLVTRYAGIVASAGFTGDGGLASNATLNGPAGLACDAAGNLYCSDMNNHRIRKIDAVTKIITTIAGSGASGFTGDGGPATSARLFNPSVLTLDQSGNIYFFDWTNFRVRKIDGAGIITTVVGNGTSSYTGDGGAPSGATISQLRGLAVRGQELYLCDFLNHAIRKIDFSLNIISTIAGNGISGYSGNGGPATSAQLSYPYGICFDPTLTELYISDAGNGRIRKLSPSMNGWAINNYAGTGASGFAGDGGPSANAVFANPATLYMNQNGLYISDNATNNRIRLSYAYCYANAGLNVNNTKGCCSGCSSVGVGSQQLAGLNYLWNPVNTLSCGNCNLPQAMPCDVNNPTNYVLTASGNFCTTKQSVVKVTTLPWPGTSCCRMGHFDQDEESNSIAEQMKTDVPFNVYPNPSDGHIFVELYDAAEFVEVIDVLGHSVYKTGPVEAGKLRVDITEFKSGIYFLMAKMNGKLEKSKLIKN